MNNKQSIDAAIASKLKELTDLLKLRRESDEKEGLSEGLRAVMRLSCQPTDNQVYVEFYKVKIGDARLRFYVVEELFIPSKELIIQIHDQQIFFYNSKTSSAGRKPFDGFDWEDAPKIEAAEPELISFLMPKDRLDKIIAGRYITGDLNQWDP